MNIVNHSVERRVWRLLLFFNNIEKINMMSDMWGAPEI